MHIKPTPRYQFINIYDYNFCLDQKLSTLIWILYLKRNELLSIYKPWLKPKKPNGKLGYFKHWYNLFLLNSRILVIFVRSKCIPKKNRTLINLPVFGHVCLRVHQGYKIFDLKKKVVAKVYDPCVSEDSVKKEIKRLQMNTFNDFAPSVLRWNYNEGWYTEDYVGCSVDVSQRSLDSEIFLRQFHIDIAPFLSDMAHFRKRININLKNYADEIAQSINLHQSGKTHLDTESLQKINDFSKTIKQKLLGNGTEHILLIFSHGDLVPANILKTDSGIKIVDWESAAHRSLLFDFYSYFFYRTACRQHPVPKLAAEINTALPILAKRLPLGILDAPQKIFSLNDTYRWIYYIETFSRLVERSRTDDNLDTMDFLKKYYTAFHQFEEFETHAINLEKIEVKRQMQDV